MRKVLFLLLALTLVGVTPAHAATAKAGAKCIKLGASATSGGKKYTCIKSGNKLLWNKGVVIKKASDVKPGMCPPKSAGDKDQRGSGITQLRANALLSMSEAAAEECANSLDWGYRLGQRDEEMFMLTKDYRIDRVTVTVMKGFVTTVDLG